MTSIPVSFCAVAVGSFLYPIHSGPFRFTAANVRFGLSQVVVEVTPTSVTHMTIFFPKIISLGQISSISSGDRLIQRDRVFLSISVNTNALGIISNATGNSIPDLVHFWRLVRRRSIQVVPASESRPSITYEHIPHNRYTA